LVLQTMDLSALVADMVEFYEPAAEDVGMELRANVATDLTISGESNLLRAMLANLIDNALKYGVSENAVVDVTLSQGRGTADISVRDYGAGVPAAERARLTDRFVRVDASRSKPGAGLGLSMVKAVVGHHGGTMVLEDAGPGFVARISLPLAK
ncbi:MAG: HAMP domain-containing sensor histidine kinase, partial [Pseudomonadota bacterium]